MQCRRIERIDETPIKCDFLQIHTRGARHGQCCVYLTITCTVRFSHQYENGYNIAASPLGVDRADGD